MRIYDRDLTNLKFGSWTVCWPINRSGIGSSPPLHWLCLCSCGKFKHVGQRSLLCGGSKSCGHNPWIKHGYRRESATSPAYRSWKAMNQRCLNPNATGYERYGGLGVTICPRWRESFTNFLADMGERPKGKTLDRFPNPAGNYEPKNCRWASYSQQISNRRKMSHCRRGHPYIGENDVIYKGHRYCRICQRDRWLRRKSLLTGTQNCV